jgi:thiol-disulfide isomerase/thioredoxin
MSSSRNFVEFEWAGFLKVLVVLILATLCLMACNPKPADAVGVWRGFIKNPSGEAVAFTLDVKKEGNQLVGSLVNGDERTTSTGGSIEGNTLKLDFDFYDAHLNAQINGHELSGVFERQWQKKTLRRELSATQGGMIEAASPFNEKGGIAGEWILRVGEPPKFWRAAFRQQGSKVRGTIIPVSGDWGELTGTFENGQLVLNRFDGINSRIFKAGLTAEGKLDGFVDLGLFDPKRKVIAERLDEQNKASVSALPDPSNYTRMSNSAEPLRFNFPDLEGRPVASTDERFKNKVVVVSITGSWCPNCHEESPLLQEFYEKYREQGLEVVGLGFEYTGISERDREQLKIFARRHRLTYPMLLAGSTENGEIENKLPQLVNFGAYPTTIFIGRDGLVKRIHTGFEGKATGERHTKLKSEYEKLIKELLEGRETDLTQ